MHESMHGVNVYILHVIRCAISVVLVWLQKFSYSFFNQPLVNLILVIVLYAKLL